MKDASYHTLRVGLAITFLWVGILIFQSPEAWGGYIQPWAYDLLPLGGKEIMLTTAVFDVIVGFLLLIDSYLWIATLLASLHLIVVLVVSGITEVTVRDIAILTGSIALFIESIPESIVNRFTKKPTTPIQ